jgi:hypothetical protein
MSAHADSPARPPARRRASVLRRAETEYLVTDAARFFGVDPRNPEVASDPDETPRRPVAHLCRNDLTLIDPVTRKTVAIHKDVPSRNLELRPPSLPPQVTRGAVGDDPRPDIHPALSALIVRESASALPKRVKPGIKGIIERGTRWHGLIVAGRRPQPPMPRRVLLVEGRTGQTASLRRRLPLVVLELVGALAAHAVDVILSAGMLRPRMTTLGTFAQPPE